ncbi:MAG: arginine repressor [Oscillospiraceae bacterium]|nr:arginine repressor [Oscillospiraceae bacterium]
MKEARQKKILNIISRYDVETQNQLIDYLREAGVKSTQATISRDIKELRLLKELSPRGTYRYVSAPAEVTDHSLRLQAIFHESVTSCVRAQNIVVVKTLPGAASAAAAAIDRMNIKDLAGSIAGDDTAMFVMHDNESAETLLQEIESYR